MQPVRFVIVGALSLTGASLSCLHCIQTKIIKDESSATIWAAASVAAAVVAVAANAANAVIIIIIIIVALEAH